MSFLSNIFGGGLKRLEGVVSSINELEADLEKKSDDELKKLSADLKERFSKGESLDPAAAGLLPEAFALVRETSRRTLGQRHFDVQLIGGIVLHEGKIAEMMTGEGKTLASTAPVYLNALAGKGVHVITVNDYLAKRDAVWMGQIYDFLGLKVGCLVHDNAYIYDPTYTKEKGELDKQRDVLGSFKVFEEFLRPVHRREAYAADITYGTNHEFGFDYLRDNLALHLKDRVQRERNFAVIDEVDSILIDEARTPLIISAPDVESSDYYRVFARIVGGLKPEEDYIVDEKLRVVNATDAGIEKVEKVLNLTNIFAPENARLVHFFQESLKAKALFHRDKEYVVRNGEVIIVDEFTGRLFLGRRYSGGLHQAIEAKENVKVLEENRTLASITIQNYFRLYDKVAGMTGTASTSAEEFHKVYNLEVVSIPTNKPMIREDLSDVIYKTKEAKFKAVVEDVKRRHEKGQSVLLGTASIQHNETLSGYLKEAGVPHEVLNAKNNEREGAIIAQAGKPEAVTVATNMAGRGVDIILGGNPPSDAEAERVRGVGGLHVIGTERHDARRIDNQLRGRSGRQGDPGSSQFFLSLEDDLLRIFGGDRIKNLMQTLNVPEDLPIESKVVSKAVGQAQARVEGVNLDIRKHLLDFDDVLNKQRTAIYNKRIKLLEAGEKNEILPVVKETLEDFVKTNEENFQSAREEGLTKPEDEEKIKELGERLAKIPERIEGERAVLLAHQLVRILDTLWIGHLENLEALRDSVNIRAYGQHEPLVEYRRDAHKLFKELDLNYGSVAFNTVFKIFEVNLGEVAKAREEEVKRREDMQARAALGKKLGRNDPCWCGSGKKYKRCHGA
ncbi:MAG: preprotein translocase subunit SecA [Candidatus Brennerbacteria bacterium]|nr:preprotein translocase subunit SecA [Candidatus Brennerbacteria bacterium]